MAGTKARGKRSATPEALLQVRGIGPAKARQLHAELGITTLEDLERALADRSIEALTGFGPARSRELAEAVRELRLEASGAAIGQRTPAARADMAVTAAEEDEVLEEDASEAVREAVAAELRRREAGARPPIRERLSFEDTLCDPATGQQGFRVTRSEATCRQGPTWPVRDGFVDTLGDSAGLDANPSIAQRVMESSWYSLFYEEFFRPTLTRLATRQSLSDAIQLSVSLAAPAANAVVVDVGCGTGNFARAFCGAVDAQAGVVIGVDLSAPMLQRAALKRSEAEVRNLHLVRGDAMALPLADGCADVLHIAGAFHLLPDRQRAMAEFLRVLRPGGTLVVGTFLQVDNPALRRIQELLDPLLGFHFFELDALRALVEGTHFETSDGQERSFRMEEEVVEGAAVTLRARAVESRAD